MSRRCAVVSTNVGGLPEVIGKEEDLYSKDHVEKFVSRIKELQQNKDLLQQEREYFYERYAKNYTLEVHLNRHREFYRKVLS